MSLTKVTSTMINQAVANIVDYGADNTGEVDSTDAIQAAIDSGAGEIYIPPGQFKVTDTIQVGKSKIIGAGISTRINSSSTTDTFRIGWPEPTGGISTGGEVSSLLLELSASAAVGIRLMETQNATVRDVYISSGIGRPNTQIGIILDGGDVSNYFNHIQNVNCVGVDIGYKFTASGSGYATSSTFIDCSALCYTDNTNSIGIAFSGNHGQDSIFIGGNLESCKKGIRMATDVDWETYRTQGTSWFGQRFEANSVCDIDWGNGGLRNTFIGYGNFGNSSAAGSINYVEGRDNTEPAISIQEDGEFTPTFVSSGASFSYDFQIGHYHRRGGIVTVTIAIKATASGTVTNPITITGLPLPAFTETNYSAAGICGYSQRAAGAVSCYITSGSSSIPLIMSPNVSATPTTLGINGASGENIFSITYKI